MPNAIITSFLIRSPDPSQSCRKVGITPASNTGNSLGSARVEQLADYMFPWVTSVARLDNCERIILHDGLPAELRERYPWVRFEEFPPEHSEIAWVRRCRQWRDYLAQRSDLERVFFTDINDVAILSDPFEWHASLGISWDLPLVGEEWTLFRDNRWFQDGYVWYPPKVRAFFEEILPDSMPVNIGLWGGKREVALALLRRIVDLCDEYAEHLRAPQLVSWDMVFFNYILQSGELFERFACVKMQDFGPRHHLAGVTIRGRANPFLHDRPSVMKRLTG